MWLKRKRRNKEIRKFYAFINANISNIVQRNMHLHNNSLPPGLKCKHCTSRQIKVHEHYKTTWTLTCVNHNTETSVVSYCKQWTHQGIFFLRNTNWSACSDVRAHLWAEIMSPVVEKILSDGTLVPGTHRYLWASLARCGYLHASDFHQPNGSSDSGRGEDSWYCWTSFSALELGDDGVREDLACWNVCPRRFASADLLFFGVCGGRSSSLVSSAGPLSSVLPPSSTLPSDCIPTSAFPCKTKKHLAHLHCYFCY